MMMVLIPIILEPMMMMMMMMMMTAMSGGGGVELADVVTSVLDVIIFPPPGCSPITPKILQPFSKSQPPENWHFHFVPPSGPRIEWI